MWLLRRLLLLLLLLDEARPAAGGWEAGRVEGGKHALAAGVKRREPRVQTCKIALVSRRHHPAAWAGCDTGLVYFSAGGKVACWTVVLPPHCSHTATS